MQSIITFFQSIFGFVETIIDSVVWLVTMIPQYVTYLTEARIYMPPFISPLLQLSIALTALFAVIRLI